MSSISYFANIIGSASIQNRFDIYAVECGTELTLFSTQIIVRCNKLIIDFNKRSLKQLVSAREKKMLLIPNVSHLFEELGALEKVAKNSIEWFNQYV